MIFFGYTLTILIDNDLLKFNLGYTNTRAFKNQCFQITPNGTNVLFYNSWDKCLILPIGGTNVMVAQMSVALMTVGQKSRHL